MITARADKDNDEQASIKQMCCHNDREETNVFMPFRAKK